ncbi:histidine kinase [Pleurocapsa sp. PCC 7319]|uniref:histidine kinase n=1 Tax=Pleurocapsa sp. PCC 7319 TaxID=118161 RepID=UPI000347EE95|nr:histidine kinase [Pleurocapsa sp. PCC 7319]
MFRVQKAFLKSVGFSSLVLQSNGRHPDDLKDNNRGSLLQLLLFIDKRSSSEEHIQRIQAYLQGLQSDYSFKLEIVEIDKQPHLVEYLKLVATPALVKVAPGPRQTLAGSNLIKQLEKWWPRWQAALDSSDISVDSQSLGDDLSISILDKVGFYAENVKLADEIFSLKKEKERLLAQLRFKDQILAMLAHDLRTPLTAASMAMETIELSEKNEHIEATKLASLKKKLFQQAKSQFSIMNHMIGELLQNSQSVSTKLRVKPSPIRLKPLCQEVVTKLETRLKQKLMTYKEDIPQDIPLVYADEELIRQLISNLLDNAIKYTPEKGQISLSILHRTNQKVQISICDTGPGIPPGKREVIFEDNFRLQRDRDQEGYGLGLAMCHQIVCAHYGQIWVDSSPSEGSCFQFTLLVYK